MYIKLPTRTASDLDSSADMNQVELNIEALKGGDPAVPPTQDLETHIADTTTKHVTNGNSHDHNGGDGGQVDHTGLSNKGSNTHAQVDTHIGDDDNVHGVTGKVVGTTDTQDISGKRISGFGSTKLASSLYGGNTDPDAITRLNWDGYFYATRVYNAYWNDIAEMVESDGSAKPGDLLTVDTEHPTFRVKKYEGKLPHTFLGIASENPGFVVGANEDFKYPLFLTLKGQVYINTEYTDDYRYKVGQVLYITQYGIKTFGDARKLNFFDVAKLGTVVENDGKRVKVFV